MTKPEKYLKSMGINYEYDATLVRGFDYYTHTIFEIQADIEGFGAQNTLCGGGRYNKLVAELGGPTVPAIGFGMGLERLLLALEAEGIQVGGDDAVDFFLITLGEDAKMFGSRLLLDLRSRGLICETDYLGKNLKGQFKQADRHHARYTAILGDDELQQGMINLKNNQTGTQQTIPVALIIDYILEDQQKNHAGCCGGHGHGEDYECCGGHGNGSSCGCQH